MKYNRFALASTSLVLAQSALAAIDYDATLSVLSSTFTDFGYTESNASVSSASNIPFVYDFSAIGEEVFNVTIQAPDGYQFKVDAPNSGFDNIQLLFEYRMGTTLNGAGSLSASSPLTFTDGLGDVPSGIDGNVRGTGPSSGDYFRISSDIITLDGGDLFTFTSIVFSVTIPDAYETAFNNSGVAALSGTAVGTTGLPDPGQWVTLVAVPEPSTYALILGLASAGLFVRKRRASRHQSR